MRIRMNVAVAGPGHAYGVGETVDAPDDRAQRLVAAGQATRVDGDGDKKGGKRQRRTGGETHEASPGGEDR